MEKFKAGSQSIGVYKNPSGAVYDGEAYGGFKEDRRVYYTNGSVHPFKVTRRQKSYNSVGFFRYALTYNFN